MMANAWLENGREPLSDDPVVHNLREAERLYRERCARNDEENSSLQSQVNEAQQAREQIEKELQESRSLLEQERKRHERQKTRNAQLADSLKSMYRTAIGGNVYELILKACLSVTGATRGLYITARNRDDSLKVRASVDVDGYPQAFPSEFIKALCHKVLDDNDTFVCNEGDELPVQPDADKPSEQFRNCLVTPVVLLKNFDGIVIAADKLHGDFEEDDVEMLLSVGDQSTVAVENRQLHRQLEDAYQSTVSMLADAVEAKDSNTHGHCEMVSRYSRLTAVHLDLDDYDRSIVCYAALLHDVGKIGVSDGILNKPGPLLPEERDLVRSHVRVGHDLISRVSGLQPVADVVLHHHEWYDGSGYPDGLRGEGIPLPARIVCVADAYCAMITKRSYKEAYSHERARDELIRCSGTQFDPQVVDVFLKVLESPSSLDWDDDDDAECGALPQFVREDFRQSVQ